MRVKLTISYIGKEYDGWQSQPSGRGVQDHVEKALGEVLGHPVRLYCAGRTDKGVNATGQVAHFDTDRTRLTPYKICLATNLLLPSDISIVDAEIAEDNFDARFWADSKTYIYRLYVSPTRKPLLDINHAQVYKPLDIEKMKRVTKLLEGTHDFATLQNTGSNLRGTVRTLHKVELRDNGDGTLEIEINGNAFLYNMVRNIAGLLVAVGSGKIKEEDVESILKSGDRRLSGKTMPACGLTLEKIHYDGDRRQRFLNLYRNGSADAMPDDDYCD